MSLLTVSPFQRPVLSRGPCRHFSRASRTIAAVQNKYILVPTGDGSADHLGGEAAPKASTITLAEGVFEVGRVAPADVVIPIPTVSSRHALIRIEENTVAVTDLNSTNGTMVNGLEIDPLASANVVVGDEIVFGDEHLAKFKLDLAPVDSGSESPAAAADAAPLAA